MAKKRETTFDDIDFYPPEEGDIMPEAKSLLNSKILFHEGDQFVWRTGHLEHIANLYKGDPQTTERDYADDLAVARAYSREQWEALIN